MDLRSISATLITVFMSLSVFGVGPMAPPALPLHAPNIPAHGGAPASGSTSSLNWSGYAVTASTGQVSDVTGNWVVPSVTCSSGSQYSSAWVGIDGYSSSSVEQTGTEQDCLSGKATYYAWYEIYPLEAEIKISGMTINAGDTMFAEVHANGGGSFTMSIQDQTNGGSFSITQSYSSAAQSSAEWIVEAPSSGGRILPLANFGTASLSNSQTTINGSTGTIGSYSSNVAITMVTSRGVTKAVPSALTNNGADFTDTWKHK